MSYAEALALAINGSLETAVLDSLRREFATVERAAAAGQPSPHAAQVSANLGVAQMDPLHFCPLLLESEAAFRASLKLDPDNEATAQSNARLTHMLANQPVVDDGGDTACGRAEPAPPPPRFQAGKTAEGEPVLRVPVLVVACCRAEYLDRSADRLRPRAGADTLTAAGFSGL